MHLRIYFLKNKERSMQLYILLKQTPNPYTQRPALGIGRLRSD